MQLKGAILKCLVSANLWDFSEQYTEAMKQEIPAHIHHNTWKTVPHRESDNLIKSS